MPKNVKPAPPQQSSLKEMWGKKRDASTTSAPKQEDAKQEDAMDLDVKPEAPSKPTIRPSVSRSNIR